jgi:RNA polymerase-interacting CarD/CdnL/TRCF family regulator
MTSDQGVYSIGDWIVHVYYGVGQILSKENMTLEGTRQMYFRIKTENSSYFLPLKKIDLNRVRPLASKYQIKKALALTRKPPRKLSKDYKVRNKEISQAINDISLYSKAKMIRDLQGRRVSDYLNLGEIDRLKNLKEDFCVEWAIVLQKNRKIAEKMLDEALRISSREIKLEQRNNGQ